MTENGHSGNAVKAEDAFPVVLYAITVHPSFLASSKQLLGERAYLGVGKALGWPIGIFARRIIMEDDISSRAQLPAPCIPASADRRESSKRGNRTTPDHQVNALAAYRRHCR